LKKYKINKTISAVFGLMLFASLLFMNPVVPTILNANAEGEPWLDGWAYRKSHVITGSSYGNVTDYIFAFKVYKDSGTDGTQFFGSTVFGKVYCNGHCRDDFMDIRFTDSDGNSTLAINVMNVTPGDCAYIWVKTSVNAYPANKTIYMYYGNDNATSDSSIAEENFFTEIGDGRTLQGNSTLPTNSTGVIPYDRFSWNTPTIVPNNSKSVYWYCNVATNFTGRLTILEGDGTTMTKRGETPVFSVDSGLTRVADMFDESYYEINMTSGWIMGHYGTGGVNAPSVSLEQTSKYYPNGYLPLSSTGNFSSDNTFDYWTAVVGYRVVVDPEPTHTSWGEEETLETPPIYGAFWLDGWTYRKSHTIINATDAGTNYQVRINIDYSNGTDSGSTVYLDGICQTDFDDIRFTDYNGSVLLDYWMETKTDGVNATFWVEISDDLSLSNALIYVYYGNDTVTTTSNGAETFVQFDDFTGNTTTMSIYNENPLKIEVTHNTTGDVLQCTWKTNSSYPYVCSHAYWNPVSSGYAMRMNYFRALPYDNSSNRIYSMYFGENYTEASPASADDDIAGHDVWAQGILNPTNRGIDNCYNSGIEVFSNPYNISISQWNVYEVTWSNTNVTTYWNDIYTWSTTNGSAVPDESLYPMVGGARGANNSTDNAYAYWDWILVRKFVENEPSHGQWGTEEGHYWLDGWNYRKNHVIANATGAGTNYQIKIAVNYGNGSDSGDTVFVDGKCQSDFDDIRFTAADGLTELDYWRMTKTDSISAIFWVEISDDLSSSNSTVYVYYGNPTVTYTEDYTDEQHGENTFLFFDNFDDGSYSSKWTLQGGSVTEENGVLKFNTGGTAPLVESIFETSENVSACIEADVLWDSGTYFNAFIGWHMPTGNWSATTLGYLCYTHQNDWELCKRPGWTRLDGIDKSFTKDVWHHLRCYYEQNYQECDYDYTSTLTASDTSATSGKLKLGEYIQYPEPVWWNYIFVRNWIPLEPTQTTWGPEEAV
jgi:hypothetical protein